jgi:hypothetical protein
MTADGNPDSIYLKPEQQMQTMWAMWQDCSMSWKKEQYVKLHDRMCAQIRSNIRKKRSGGGREQKQWYEHVTKLLDVDITHGVTQPYYGINKWKLTKPSLTINRTPQSVVMKRSTPINRILQFQEMETWTRTKPKTFFRTIAIKGMWKVKEKLIPVIIRAPETIQM